VARRGCKDEWVNGEWMLFDNTRLCLHAVRKHID